MRRYAYGLVLCLVILLISCGAPAAERTLPSPTARAPARPLPSVTPPPSSDTPLPLPTATPLPPTSTPRPSPTTVASPTIAARAPEMDVATRANEVVAALRDRDMEALAGQVHPSQGVRFSPYGYVQLSDLVFLPGQVRGLLDDPTVYHWGVYDGSGLPINLTFAEYYAEFVYDLDFANAPEVGINRRMGPAGGTLDNTVEFYPGAIVVEYHFPGVDPQYAGMDWRSLRLVFREEGGTWYLVGIIHDEWTI